VGSHVSLCFVLGIGISLVEACKAFPDGTRHFLANSSEIASRRDPGGDLRPDRPLEGRSGQGRSRETSRGAALEKLCEISFHALLLPKQPANRSSSWDRYATVTRQSPPWCCNPPCYKFFCLLRAPLLQERFFLLQYRPLSR